MAWLGQGLCHVPVVASSHDKSPSVQLDLRFYCRRCHSPEVVSRSHEGISSESLLMAAGEA
jgi:hypothetical protein